MSLSDRQLPCAEAIKDQLDRILSSPVFLASQRSRSFLEFVVERTQAGSSPKEYEIAVEVLKRNSDYNTTVDAAVRVEAGRLRNRLRDYYDAGGREDKVLIEMPKGAYSATFSLREPQQAGPGDENLENSADLPVPAGKFDNSAAPGVINAHHSGISSTKTPRESRWAQWALTAGSFLLVGSLATGFLLARQHVPSPTKHVKPGHVLYCGLNRQRAQPRYWCMPFHSA